MLGLVVASQLSIAASTPQLEGAVKLANAHAKVTQMVRKANADHDRLIEKARSVLTKLDERIQKMEKVGDNPAGVAALREIKRSMEKNLQMLTSVRIIEK